MYEYAVFMDESLNLLYEMKFITNEIGVKMKFAVIKDQ